MFGSKQILDMIALIDSFTLILSFALCFVQVIADGNARKSMEFSNSFITSPSPRFISFDSKDGDIEINWDVSIPFFTIPLNPMSADGKISPLLNVNPKGLSVAGLLTTILAIVVPLLSKPGPGMHYRSDSQWSRMGDTINEIMFDNNYVTPCIQRVICSLVSEASHSRNPSSTDKIIDGLSSHKWFKEFMNGTVLQEAVKIGRDGNRDCGHAYKQCFVTSRILKNMMTQFGAI